MSRVRSAENGRERLAATPRATPWPGGRSDASVKSAVRVFEILELFKELKRPLRLTEITRQFKYPASSASALLKTMTAHGYLSFHAASHSYFPTVRLSHVVDWVPGIEFERRCVLPAMQRLHGRTQEWTVLCAINDVFVEFIEVLRSSHPIQLWSPPGTRHPLVKVGVGWLFLDHMAGGLDPSQSPHVASLYRQTLARGLMTKNELSLKTLCARLRELRGKDHIFTTAETYAPHKPPGHLGGSMVSMLLPGPATHRPLALAVGGPADRIAANLDDILAEMRREIKVIAVASRRIGETSE